MIAPASRLAWVLCAAVFVAATAAACGSGKSTTAGVTGSGGAATTAATGGGSGNGGNDGGIVIIGAGGSCATPGLDVQPAALQTITVPAGTMAPTVPYTATLNCMPVQAGWTVDKGNVGSVPAGNASSVVFTPSGTTGGTVTITAGINGMTVQRQVLVKLTATQNGPNTTPGEVAQIPTMTSQLTAGGGVGGVGGEGLGPAVTDPATMTALAGPTGSASSQSLVFLYPYDKTVWPRGLLAPLLMWQWMPADADAIQIQLATQSGSYSYTGTFGKPAILGTTGKFIRMPIPQDVWDAATNSAGGTDTLTLSLTVAKAGVGYGPISETWTIAPGLLDGVIYYQSYGTALAQNLCCRLNSTTAEFGGAVLSIHVGDSGPKLTAGTSGTNPSGCRVCHSVASGGSRLVVVDGNDESLSSTYDLSTTPAAQLVMNYLAQYPAMYPDGSLALTPGGLLLPLPNDATPIPTTGLTSVVTNLGQPAFSPDGTMIAFNPLAGTLKLNQSLYVMSFAKATSTFSAPVQVADDSTKPSTTQPSWPAFFPDSKSVVYHHQTAKSIEDNLATRAGSYAQIYWTSTKSPSDVTPLDNLNGKGYLPKLPAPSTMTCTADGYSVAANPSTGVSPNLDHSDDVDMNYEPTVNPVASGGYAWVVFTSRRMYGNEATIPPFCSDPRGVDTINNITTKKLWVAAVDLSQAPGADSSHPAFYLPGQELLAGNARGFWVLDPCQADGTTCTTGDQCCNGYCEAGDGGGLVCSSAPPVGSCSAVGDKCTTAANCCDPSDSCIGGFCAVKGPT